MGRRIVDRAARVADGDRLAPDPHRDLLPPLRAGIPAAESLNRPPGGPAARAAAARVSPPPGAADPRKATGSPRPCYPWRGDSWSPRRNEEYPPERSSMAIARLRRGSPVLGRDVLAL